jgi:hypothetical protein
LTGAEIVAIVQGGLNKRTTTQGIADLGGGSGVVMLSGGLVTVGAPWIGHPAPGLLLPADYLYFRLRCGVIFDQSGTPHADLLAIAFSYNGTTFLNDQDGFDSYFYSLWSQTARNQPVNLIGGITSTDAMGMLMEGVSPDANPHFMQSYDMTIFPGSATEFSSVECQSSVYTGPSPLAFIFTHSRTGVNPVAAVTPTAARASVLRVQPYGGGDTDPPTSGTDISVGSWWVLEGVAA